MIKSDSESRRVRMTKRMLKDALMELMEEKPLAAVSVTDLCQLADVNRSTFYSYYNDTIELLDEIKQDILAQIPAPSHEHPLRGNDEELFCAFTDFFEYVRTHAKDFRLMLHAGDARFSEQLVEIILKYFRNPETEIGTETMIRWGYLYAIYGSIGMMRDWIDNGFPVSSKEFARFALDMSFRANDFSVYD